MFRLLFVMATTILVGLGSGYLLWGSRVARLTDALNTLTLESDTMRVRLGSPHGDDGPGGNTRAADELRVINESIAAFRQEMAEQKVLLEKTTVAPADVAGSTAELQTARNDLAACMADKQDLELRCSGAVTSPPPPSPIPGTAPTYQVPHYRPPGAVQPAPLAAPSRSPGLDVPHY